VPNLKTFKQRRKEELTRLFSDMPDKPRYRVLKPIDLTSVHESVNKGNLYAKAFIKYDPSIVKDQHTQFRVIAD